MFIEDASGTLLNTKHIVRIVLEGWEIFACLKGGKRLPLFKGSSREETERKFEALRERVQYGAKHIYIENG